MQSLRKLDGFFWIVTLLVLGAVTLPYLYAARAAGPAYEFGGFLLNPLDGNSYLAKMAEGWRGEWLFTLPYTAQKGQGSFLFVFYLFLGHLARTTGLSLIVTFHAARLLAAVFLLAEMNRFFNTTLPDSWRHRLAFWFAAAGSGMGWLALPFGAFTADFWVAETYPFLSAYANPHFPLGLGLMLRLIHVKDGDGKTFLSTCGAPAVSALILALVSPFGVVITLTILGGLFALEVLAPALRNRIEKSSFRLTGAWYSHPILLRILVVSFAGVPLLLYDVMVARTDPLLAAWNAQNLTPSPPAWDVVLSLSPLLFLASIGVLPAWKSRSPFARVWLVWAVLGLLLVYLPSGLQRRFMMGLYFPLSGLAVFGLDLLAGLAKPGRRVFLNILVSLLILPTNLLILLTVGQAVRTHDPLLYLTQGEVRAMNWLEANTAPDALVLASAETGLFIPAHTGRRVIYGHPFETADADAQKAAVQGFFQGQVDQQEFLVENAVDYLFVGPRERALGDLSLELPVVFESKDVILFEGRLQR